MEKAIKSLAQDVFGQFARPAVDEHGDNDEREEHREQEPEENGVCERCPERRGERERHHADDRRDGREHDGA